MMKYFVSCVDYGETCDGKPRCLGVYNTHDEAKEFVKNDMDSWMDKLPYQDKKDFCVNYNRMSISNHVYDEGCEWNIDEIDVRI